MLRLCVGRIVGDRLQDRFQISCKRTIGHYRIDSSLARPLNRFNVDMPAESRDMSGVQLLPLNRCIERAIGIEIDDQP